MFLGVAIFVGVTIGLNAPIQFPTRYVRYSAVLILCGIDAALGGGLALVRGSFKTGLLLRGLLFNSVAAGVLCFIGDALGLELYFAAVVALGIRIFRNLGVLSDHL
jgi:small basic protein